MLGRLQLEVVQERLSSSSKISFELHTFYQMSDLVLETVQHSGSSPSIL